MSELNGAGVETRKPRVVLFSGGSACRTINIALCQRDLELTRVVPAWDSGGSSKVIRESLGILPIGDIRQALMTMAHGEGRAGEVVKVCNVRLSDAPNARSEFELYAEGAHPSMKAMEAGLRGVILEYLNLFKSRIGDDFDLRHGSIGNFILTGAYLAHRCDINRAIFAFRKICSIGGNVWPVSVRNDLHLTATLRNGQEIFEQHRVTSLGGAEASCGIAEVRLDGPGSRASGTGRVTGANSAVIEAVRNADVIVFGPGSFFTSIVPHLMVDGIVDAIAGNRRARKIFISNILECAETTGRTLAELIEIFLGYCRACNPSSITAGAFLHRVLMNQDILPFDKTSAGFRYLKGGDLTPLRERNGIEIVMGDFEDGWHRGQHDGKAVASIVVGLAAETVHN